MMVRAIVESIRTAAFRKKRQALHDGAAGVRHGLLEAVGSDLLIPDIQQYRARGPNGDYTIFVTLPSAPPPKTDYPVLWLLDGNAWVAGAAEALRLQSRFALQSEIEPMLIVAVGYPGEEPFDLGRRAYDYLPEHTSGKLSERFMQGAPWHQPGGADAFLDFLTGPLREDIAARYPVDGRRHILCGHSFGGFFTLYALLHRPGAFRRYAALSPSLWWDDAQLLKAADAAIAALPRDLMADVLIAVGERETHERPKISARMLDDSSAFVDRLEREGLAGVSVDYRVLAGENHQSLLITAFSAVLRFASMNGGRV